MLRIITINTNGLRSAAKKGFFSWLSKQNADVVCVQETKCHQNQLIDDHFFPAGYHAYFFDAEKKGYSGVALYSRKKPDKIHTGLGWQSADSEGRYIQADFQDLSIASIYLPSGSSGDIRQAVKYEFMAHYEKVLLKQKNDKRQYILCGDWNIAHKPIDLTHWKANQKISGFLPEERAWLDKVLGPLGYVDAFRVINQEPEQYTWWSLRSKTAFEKNVGWRIDYHIVSPGLQDKIHAVDIYKGEKFSDHAPVIIDYKIVF